MEARLLVEQEVEMPTLMEEDLYRIVQEALNNALKHAAATAVTVRLCIDGEGVALEVIDNGQGFDLDPVSDVGGMGLVNMRERAEKLGGLLTILSAPGEGTKVTVKIQIGKSSGTVS
jgi:NarL family two-component system sensor histidine kinase LiaS